MALSAECMPLSSVNKSPLVEQQKSDDVNNHRKRKNIDKHSPTSGQQKRFKEETTDMTDSQKKANFSAVTPPNNGYKHPPVANNKPGSAKKLIIKNFKGNQSVDFCTCEMSYFAVVKGFNIFCP